MELKSDEEKLVDIFRRLNNEGKVQAMQYLSSLAEKQARVVQDQEETKSQCSLDLAEARPERAKEPIFTE